MLLPGPIAEAIRAVAMSGQARFERLWSNQLLPRGKNALKKAEANQILIKKEKIHERDRNTNR